MVSAPIRSRHHHRVVVMVTYRPSIVYPTCRRSTSHVVVLRVVASSVTVTITSRVIALIHSRQSGKAEWGQRSAVQPILTPDAIARSLLLLCCYYFPRRRVEPFTPILITHSFPFVPTPNQSVNNHSSIAYQAEWFRRRSSRSVPTRLRCDW